MEIFPKIHLLLLVDHTQSVKPLHVSEEKSNEDTLNSPYQAHDTGARNDTWGKCPWLPHHNQCPEVHGKLHGILLGIKDKKRKTLGDSFLKRKETGIKDCYKRTQDIKEVGLKDYIKDHERTKGYLDTFGVKCHLGRKLDNSGLPTLFDIMIEMKGSEETQNKTRIVLLDSDKDRYSLSACVTHSYGTSLTPNHVSWPPVLQKMLWT